MNCKVSVLLEFISTNINYYLISGNLKNLCLYLFQVSRLRKELREAQSQYSKLLAESQLLEKIKVENKVIIVTK